MESGRSELRWSVEQRFEFIEFRLFWEGYVNHSDLMDQFRVSVNRASTDLDRYIEPPRVYRRVFGSMIRLLLGQPSSLRRMPPLLRAA